MKRATRGELTKKVQELSFACLDMNLYLDNHPEDKKAINKYNALCTELAKAKYEYENKYGPLTNFGYSPSKYPWEWVSNPWPWDAEVND